MAHRAWTRVTWSRLVQVHGLVDFVHAGVLLVAALGAARVRVHGLVDCVRDGVLLYVSWWKVPVIMQPKFRRLTDSGWCLFRSSTECWTLPVCYRDRYAQCILAEDWRVHNAVLGRSCYHTRCCERQERMGPDNAETVWKCRKCSSCRCGRRCEHAATSPSAPGRCFRPVHRQVVDSVCGFFRRLTHFSHPFRRKRVPIFQPSSTHSCEPESPGVVL